MKKLFLTIFGVLVSTTLFAHSSLGLQVGLWKPSSIDQQPSKPFANIKGASPALGVCLASPEWQGFALQATAWGWRQSSAEGDVRLLHLSADLKNLLISPTLIRPYVTYGAAMILGKWREFGFTQQGMSINFGAGLDISLGKPCGLALEYQYLYTIFNKKFGLTDNYSGPKLTAKWLFHL
jgi:hypothetical protein